MERASIKIWTDGSCTTKEDKKGGMGVYLVAPKNREFTLRRGYWNTTTPRMEMRALIAAVRMINPEIFTDVLIYCDSKFIVDAIMRGGVRQWRADNWHGVANADLWQEFVTEVDFRRKMRLFVKHINGHQKDLLNEEVFGNHIADALANYKTQESYIQDKPLEGFSWFYHEGSDLVFIEKTERYEAMNKMGDVLLLWDCLYADEEELLTKMNGTHFIEAYSQNKLDIDFKVKMI